MSSLKHVKHVYFLNTNLSAANKKANADYIKHFVSYTALTQSNNHCTAPTLAYLRFKQQELSTR